MHDSSKAKLVGDDSSHSSGLVELSHLSTEECKNLSPIELGKQARENIRKTRSFNKNLSNKFEFLNRKGDFKEPMKIFSIFKMENLQ